MQYWSTDGTNVLPTVTIGETPEYIVASYVGLWISYQSEFIIVSTEDSTEISITPSVNTLSGKPANVPFTINLNKGETYQVMAQDTGDLTGTSVKTIKGSCAMFSGAASCTLFLIIAAIIVTIYTNNAIL